MGIKLKNNAVSTLAVSISETDVGLIVASSEGDKFPTLGFSDYFYATLANNIAYEVVKVTARSGDAMTIVRGQEGTLPLAFSSGARFEARITAQSVLDAARYSETVSVKDFGAKGNGTADDTAAIQAAVNAGKRIHFPPGTYRVTSAISLSSDRLLFGDGAASVISYEGTAASQGALYVNSGSSTVYVDNIIVRDLKVLGQVSTAGFSEFVHLISFSGVRNCLIDNCEIVGFRGDGIYIGSGDLAGQERHNIDVTISNCYIDGVNNDNRNGISVIDGTSVTIENNYFTRCTRSNMPGAIDIEPDANNYHIVRNISIRNNRIFDCRGGVGAITIFLGIQTWTIPPNGFLIEGNYIDTPNAPDNSTYGIFFELGNPFATPTPVPPITESTPDVGLRILNNYVKFPSTGLGRCLVTWNCNNTLVADNTFIGGATSLIGYPGTAIFDYTLRNNAFISVNGAGDYAISIFTGSRISIIGNLFKDCGATSGVARGAIEFNTGTTSYVDIIDNTFISPNGGFTQQAVRDSGHTFTSATNRFIGNSLIAGSNQFLADTTLNNNPIALNNNIPNLGLNANPTTYRLTVDSGSTPASWFKGTGGNPQITATDGTVTQLAGYANSTFAFHGTQSNHPLALITNNTARMEISAAAGNVLFNTGNIGVGHGPNDWNSASKAIQISSWASLATDASNRPVWVNNAFLNTGGSYQYINNGPALRLRLKPDTTGGNLAPQLDFATAASGTAGGTASFATRFFIDSEGRACLNNSLATDAWAKWRFGGNIPTSSNQSVVSDARYTIPSGSTNFCLGYQSFASTEAASFTLTTLKHYSAEQGTIGAGSAITDQVAFFADSSLTGATNNYGFYGAIAAGSNRFNCYMGGTANNYFAGNVGIGGVSFGGGSSVIALANATVVPSTNPSGGGVLYVEGGALKYRGSSGTVTTIANA